MATLAWPAAPARACAHCALPAGAAEFCCFGCRIAAGLLRPAAEGGDVHASERASLLLRLGLGGFLGMNVMVFSWLHYGGWLFAGAAFLDARARLLEGLFSYLLLFLTTLVLVFLGAPLLIDFLERRRSGAWWRMDAATLVLIGAGCAWGLSAAHTFAGRGALYYDSAAAILVLVTLDKLLEARARRAAVDSARALAADLPARAWVLRGGVPMEVAADAIAAGERLWLRPGDGCAADGVVRAGSSQVAEASLTGEHAPRAVGPGDVVLAGSLNLDGLLEVEATRVGAARAIERMQAALEAARSEPPRIQRLADRVAGAFTPAVLLIAVAVAALSGLEDALSVLLVSCPCALGLAAPLATHFALRRAARRGLLVDSAATLERAARVDTLLFDKTGTLGEGRLELSKVLCAGGLAPERALELAAGLESASSHPVAQALLAAARARGLDPPPAGDRKVLPGRGVEGVVAGRRLFLGNSRLLAARGLAPGEPAPGLDVALGDETGLLARFVLRERLRSAAAGAVAGLRSLGIRVTVVSGDSPGAVAAIATPLGLAFRALALPADKVALVHAARARGVVAMVGDGVNDAPVLAAADLGIVMGSGAALARSAGHVTLLGDRLERLPELFVLARRTMSTIRLNLLWAFGYNSIGVALAAFGHLNPVVAAVFMFCSSLFVLLTSRRAGVEG